VPKAVYQSLWGACESVTDRWFVALGLAKVHCAGV